MIRPLPGRNDRRARRVLSAGSRRPAPLVHLVSEGIVCDLYVRSSNAREQSSVFELIIANKGGVPIASRLYSIDTDAHTREYGMLTVPSHSAGSSLFAMPLESDRHIYVEISGEGLSLFAEALQPSARSRRHHPSIVVASLMLAVATTLTAVYLAVKPSVEVLGVPTATMGGTVRDTFAIGGSATTRYRATTTDGRVVADGKLTAASGELAFDVPTEATDRTMHLSVVASGLLGRAARSISFVIPASHVGERDAIAGLPAVVHRDVDATGGQPVDGQPASLANGFIVPAHIVAGQAFNVSVARQEPGLRIAFRDELDAIVEDVAVAPAASSVSLRAPASPTLETYRLVGTFDRNDRRETFERVIHVYPR